MKKRIRFISSSSYWDELMSKEKWQVRPTKCEYAGTTGSVWDVNETAGERQTRGASLWWRWAANPAQHNFIC